MTGNGIRSPPTELVGSTGCSTLAVPRLGSNFKLVGHRHRQYIPAVLGRPRCSLRLNLR